MVFTPFNLDSFGFKSSTVKKREKMIMYMHNNIGMFYLMDNHNIRLYFYGEIFIFRCSNGGSKNKMYDTNIIEKIVW